MELILKQPKDKPPCICILFDRGLDAEKLNYSWLESKAYLFSLIFEIEGSNLDVILWQEELGLKHRYINLINFPDKLFRFLYNTKGTELFSFCHIFSHDNKHLVASKPNGHGKDYWVLKVNKVVVKKDA